MIVRVRVCGDCHSRSTCGGAFLCGSLQLLMEQTQGGLSSVMMRMRSVTQTASSRHIFYLVLFIVFLLFMLFYWFRK